MSVHSFSCEDLFWYHRVQHCSVDCMKKQAFLECYCVVYPTYAFPESSGCRYDGRMYVSLISCVQRIQRLVARFLKNGCDSWFYEHTQSQISFLLNRCVCSIFVTLASIWQILHNGLPRRLISSGSQSWPFDELLSSSGKNVFRQFRKLAYTSDLRWLKRIANVALDIGMTWSIRGVKGETGGSSTWS